jgi:WD40 repeat protein
VGRHKRALTTAVVVAAAALAALGGTLAVLIDSNQRIDGKHQEALRALGEKDEALAKEKLATAAKDRALTAEQNATAVKDQALTAERRTSYLRAIALAQREWLANRVARAREVLLECPEDLRGWEWHHLMRLCQPTGRVLRGSAPAAFSHDGRYLALLTDAGGKRPSAVTVWERATGREVRTVPGPQEGIQQVVLRPDGAHLLVLGKDGGGSVWDVASGKELFRLPTLEKMSYRVTYDLKGEVLATLLVPSAVRGKKSPPPEIKLWRATTGEEIRSWQVTGSHLGGPGDLAFSPDGQTLAVSVPQFNVEAFDTATGKRIAYLTPPIHTSSHPGRLAFNPGGTLLQAGSYGTVCRWVVTKGVRLSELQALPGTPGHFSADGRHLVSTTEEGMLKVWNTETWQEPRTFRGLSHGLLLSGDGRWGATAAGPGVRVLDVSADQAKAVFQHPHPLSVTDIAANVEQGLLAVAQPFGKLTLWDLTTGKERYALAGTEGNNRRSIGNLAFTPDGQLLAGGWSDGAVTLWDTATGKEWAQFPGDKFSVNWLAFSPDGQRLAAADFTGNVKVWDVRGRRQLFRLTPQDLTLGPVKSDVPEKFRDKSPPDLERERANPLGFDGKHLLTEARDRWARQWDVDTGRVTARFQTPVFLGGVLAARPEDGTVVTAGLRARDGRAVDVTAFDRAGRELARFRGHTGLVSAACLSPDGTRLVSASSEDGTVRLWDFQSGQELLILPAPVGRPPVGVASLQFSRDGRLFAVGSRGLVYTWNGTPLSREEAGSP